MRHSIPSECRSGCPAEAFGFDPSGTKVSSNPGETQAARPSYTRLPRAMKPSVGTILKHPGLVVQLGS